MIDALQSWARRRGVLVAWGPVEVVEDALDDVVGHPISSALAAYASEALCFDGADRLRARGLVTVIAVARPRPAGTVGFEAEGGRLDALLPPTYVRYRETIDEAGAELRQELPGRRVEPLRAPLKQVAARLGLVSYGRNNLTYAPGLGSWVQLLGYLTDAVLPPLPGRLPAPPALLSRCLACRSCERACPTGAIGETFAIDADRCLSFANERPGAWPAWADPAAHHALLGCVRCQVRCPENPELRVEPSGVVFTREETAAILKANGRTGPVWDRVRLKLEELGQPEAETVLGRNLAALIAARGA